jgi:heptosyltransferase-2
LLNAPGPQSIGKILIRVNNWIGDVVMISPAMRAVRRTFPQAEITLLAKTWVLDALRGSPYYDRLIEYDRDGSHSDWRGRWALIRSLRRENFDLALLFQKAFEAALFSYLARIPRRVGFRTDSRACLLTDPVELPQGLHHAEQFFRIAEAVGAEVADRRLSFHLTARGKDGALGLLHRLGLDEKNLLIAVHPGASKPQRAWPADRLGQVVRTLMAEYEAMPILLGSITDAKALATIRMTVGPGCTPPVDALNLQEMAALLRHCQLLICNDSGPMHIAAALRVPVVAVFGPGSRERTGPLTDPFLFRVVSHDFPCSPCRQKYFRECLPASSGKPWCLDGIGVEEVLDNCREMLEPARREFV